MQTRGGLTYQMRGPPPRIVPWTSLDEWRFVRDGLFSPKDQEMQELAFEIVRIWMGKGRVPTAVEATINLVQVAMADNQSAEGHSLIIRLAYAAAITRFVNEIVDPRQGGVSAIPITRLAEQIGLPRILVDLRHESVHDNLASLEMFRHALEEALAWLYKSYWIPQSAHDQHLTDRITIGLQRTAAAIKACPDERPNYGKIAGKNMVEVDYLYSSVQVISTLCDLLLSEQFCEEPKLLDSISEMFTNEGAELYAPALVGSLLRLSLVDRIYNAAISSLLPLINSKWVAEKALIAAMRSLVMNPSARALDLAERVLTKCPPGNQPLVELYVAIRSGMSQKVNIPASKAIRTIEDIKQRNQPDGFPTAGWGLAPNWRPCAMGCTPSYNPAHDFMSLWNKSCD